MVRSWFSASATVGLIAKTACLFAFCSVVLSGSPVRGGDVLKVSLRVPPGPHFVGQGIEIQVEADAEARKTEVRFEPPRSSAFEIHSLPTRPDSPGVGRFVVVPGRAGSLDVGPFRVHLGDRSGSSRPSRLTVTAIPNDRRSPAFLGGVGSFDLRAEAEPTTLRAGQTLEFRIKLTGSAAWGSLRPPDLSAWTALAGGMRVEPLEDLLESAVPPTRMFRFRLRAKTAGRVVLPPMAIASFDAKSSRFITRSTSSIPLTVESPPGLDPSTLDYSPIGTSSGGQSGVYLLVCSFLVSGIAGAGLWVMARRRRQKKRVNPASLALELSQMLGKPSAGESGRVMSKTLTGYLERVLERPPGALTPSEAFEAFERLTGDRDLAESARRIVGACDRARYRERADEPDELIGEGRRFFERVAEVMSREAKGPREAAGTA